MMRWTIILLLSITLLNATEIKIEGNVLINGKKANTKMKVNLGDYIVTSKKSKIVFNIGQDAFMAKGKSEFSIEQGEGVRKINVISGGLLGVFKKGSKYKLSTENMTAGIRGTGVFIQSKEHKSYFCTCYGKTEVEVSKKHFTMQAEHHKMIWVKENGEVKAAKELEGHTDEELRELEAFVGRVPTFDK